MEDSNLKVKPNKVTLYHLARELGQENWVIIEDARRMGVDAKVVSNTVSKAIADKIRSLYKPYPANRENRNLPAKNSRLVKATIQTQACESDKKRSGKAVEEQGVSIESDQARNIILESKKATRVSATGKCDKCQLTTSPLWKYSKSNVDEVLLCSRCKQIVYAKSFGSIDALDVAEQGGLFERNKRKH